MHDTPTDDQSQPPDSAPGPGWRQASDGRWEPPSAPGGPGGAPAPGKGFSITAIVLGAISFLILPPYFGIPALIFAAVALKKRQKMAKAAIIVAVLGLVVGTALNAFLYNAFHG